MLDKGKTVLKNAREKHVPPLKRPADDRGFSRIFGDSLGAYFGITEV